MPDRKNVCFLASGGGGTFRFLCEATSLFNLPLKIVALIADRECDALTSAKHYGVATNIVKYTRKDNSQLLATLKQYSPDLIVTNIHKILDSELLQAFPNKFINLHYSLLPKYAGMIGMQTVDAAKKNGDTEIGGTCHEVNEIVDNGKILSQKGFAVDWNQDIKIIYDEVFRVSCNAFLDGVMKKMHISNTLVQSEKMTNDFWLRVKNAHQM